MQVLLKTRGVNIKPKNFRREGMLAGKFLRTMNPTLPRGYRHRPIINSGAGFCRLFLAFDAEWVEMYRTVPRSAIEVMPTADMGPFSGMQKLLCSDHACVLAQVGLDAAYA